MDFITGLPKSHGYEAILVVVDRLSKYSHFILLKHPYTAKTIAEIFTKEVIRLHGIPKAIVSDRDPIFVSNFWKEVFRLQGTQLKMSIAYHPQMEGQTEVVNRCLETFLRCFIADQPRNWVHWLHWAEYWYSTSFHQSTGTTPFEAVYGRKPPVITRFLKGETLVEAVQKELIDRDEALQQLKQHMLRAQNRMKSQADSRRQERSFDIGEWVFLKLRTHRQSSVVSKIHPKLASRFYGPFEVIGRVGVVAYKLKLPPTSKIHPVFHVSLLKKAIGNYSVEAELPAGIEGEQSEDFEPVAILATRQVLKRGENMRQVLIQWKGQAPENATWEDMLTIQSQFPNFSLEDKTVTIGGGSDRTPRVVTKERGQVIGFISKNTIYQFSEL
ncbi:MAG: hypothetical protein Q8877_02475 [Sweet potato little leaf phytoplasma]|nr:hypothetical protein [Sweet potato little leaf phytoplasma]